MVALSPRFTFLATFCALAAFSSVPVSDASVLRLRASDPALANMAPGHWFRSQSSPQEGHSPVLPLPVEPHKKTPDSSDNKNDQRIPSAGGSHGEKDVSAGDGSKDSSDDDDNNVHEEGGKVSDRRWNPYPSITRLSKLWFGDNHVHYSRAPHHHHHHHHHHDRYRRSLGNLHHDRDLPAPGPSAHDQNVVHPVARHHNHHHPHRPYEKVVVSGDYDHVHVGRSPHHNHHHHHNGHENEKVVISGDHDHVRLVRSPIPHHHHHHHGGNEKVIISGDHDHVRVDRSSDERRGLEDKKVTTSRGNGHDHLQRSVFIAGEQGQSYVVPRAAKRSAKQKLLTLGKRAGGMDGVPGRIDVMSPTDDASEVKRIASLVLASPNTTTTTSENSTTSPSAFVLNASDISGTQVYLHPSSSNSSTSMLDPDEIVVTIEMEMFDVRSASNVPYCATYDPDPPAPAPLTAEECTEDPVGERRSQLFAFDRTTRVVRPMWFNVQDAGKDECIDDANHAAPQNASLPSVTEANNSHPNSTSSSDRGLTSNITVLTADPHMTPSNESEGSIQRAQNVALVFVASNPEVMDTPLDASTTVSSVLATTTTAMASSSPGSLATSSSVTTSSSSSATASTVPSASSNTSVVSSGMLASVPSSTAPVSGAVATSSMVLGVQVIPESASQVASTTSSSATPTVTPVNTQPYDWMFYPDS